MVALQYILDFLHHTPVIKFSVGTEAYVPISELWILVIGKYLKIRHYNVQYCDVSILLYSSPFIALSLNLLIDTTQSSEFTGLNLRKVKIWPKSPISPKIPKYSVGKKTTGKTTTDAKKLRCCWKLEDKYSTHWLFRKQWLIIYFKVSRGSA